MGMVATHAYSLSTGEQFYIGAASVKMGAVVMALRASGRRAALVSLPPSGAVKKSSHLPALTTGQDGFPALFLPISQSPVFRKLRGFWTFGTLATFRVRRGDMVLFYNHAMEYLLALIILRLRGIAVYQDIEDAPTAADRGMRGLLNRIGYRAMLTLSSPRKITVSEQMGRDMGLAEFVAIQGVAARIEPEDESRGWEELKQGGPLRLHYGGSLKTSTGLDLFCDMIELLQSQLLAVARIDGREVVFEVTGIGDFTRLRALVAGCPPGLRLELHGTVDRNHYEALLRRCHAGISLKLPDDEISSTTFPSKVIEITSRGLALVASIVSDVGVIFGEKDAFLVPSLNAETLAATIRTMAINPAEVHRRAVAGQQVARQRFAQVSVGARLAAFLEAGREGQN